VVGEAGLVDIQARALQNVDVSLVLVLAHAVVEEGALLVEHF
jgi:hypothetical protein